jgi:hypothetical protein
LSSNIIHETASFALPHTHTLELLVIPGRILLARSFPSQIEHCVCHSVPDNLVSCRAFYYDEHLTCLSSHLISRCECERKGSWRVRKGKLAMPANRRTTNEERKTNCKHVFSNFLSQFKRAALNFSVFCVSHQIFALVCALD